MSRRKNDHDWSLPEVLSNYARERGVIYHNYSKFHNRLIYQGTEKEAVAIIDIWTTHKYWVMQTNYLHGIVERGGEKGEFPSGKKKIYKFLDEFFFVVEMQETA